MSRRPTTKQRAESMRRHPAGKALVSNKVEATFHPYTTLNESVQMAVYLDEVGAHEITDNALCDPVCRRSIFDETWCEGSWDERYDDIEDELDAISKRD